MLQRPLHVGGLALASAVATATLAMTTFLVSNLILAVVAGIGLTGGIVTDSSGTGSGDAVQGLLLSAEPEDRPACRSRADRPRVQPGPTGAGDATRVRCAGQRGSAGPERP